MARIRSVKPEFWDDRKLARSASRDARMLYMGMWNQSDEHGRLNGDAAWLKGRVFAFDDDITPDVVDKLLAELDAAGRIIRYEGDGDPFIFIPRLGNHQRLEPDKVASRLPEPPPCAPSLAPTVPPESDVTAPRATSSERRADQSVPDADSSSLLYVAGSMEQVAGSRVHGGAARTAQPSDADTISAMSEPKKSPRATRINDWQPSVADIEWARAQGFVDEFSRYETTKFGDYWRAKSGRDATKTDWPATWRNWLRRAAENCGGRASPSASPATAKAQGWLDIGAELRQTPQAIEGATA